MRCDISDTRPKRKQVIEEQRRKKKCESDRASTRDAESDVDLTQYSVRRNSSNVWQKRLPSSF